MLARILRNLHLILGKYYDSDKIERYLQYFISIYPPPHVVNNPNYTLTMEIEKVSMNVPRGSKDNIVVGGVNQDFEKRKTFNFSSPWGYIGIEHYRNVNSRDIDTNPYFGVEKIPGFSVQWSFNDKYLKSVKKFKDGYYNLLLRR